MPSTKTSSRFGPQDTTSGWLDAERRPCTRSRRATVPRRCRPTTCGRAPDRCRARRRRAGSGPRTRLRRIAGADAAHVLVAGRSRAPRRAVPPFVVERADRSRVTKTSSRFGPQATTCGSAGADAAHVLVAVDRRPPGGAVPPFVVERAIRSEHERVQPVRPPREHRRRTLAGRVRRCGNPEPPRHDSNVHLQNLGRQGKVELVERVVRRMDVVICRVGALDGQQARQAGIDEGHVIARERIERGLNGERRIVVGRISKIVDQRLGDRRAFEHHGHRLHVDAADHVHVDDAVDAAAFSLAQASDILLAANQSLLLAAEQDQAQIVSQLPAREDAGNLEDTCRPAAVVVRAGASAGKPPAILIELRCAVATTSLRSAAVPVRSATTLKEVAAPTETAVLATLNPSDLSSLFIQSAAAENSGTASVGFENRRAWSPCR